MNTYRVSLGRKFLSIVFAALMAFGLSLGTVGESQAYYHEYVPITSIASVTPGVSVTVSGANFPVGQVFTVTMGPYGSYGIGGIVVGSYDTSAGGYFTASYAIPSSLASASLIAIRFQSTSTATNSYNWFTNMGGGISPIPGYMGYPTFDIQSVVAGSSVTILTHNMPVGEAFTVRMNTYGTLGMGGVVVGTTSDSGGSYSQTFNIPGGLAGNDKIAIRLDGPDGYYYAYNWFYNNNSSVPCTPVPPIPGYVGIPTISIQAVVRDSSVTIYGNNFPAGQSFSVLMGPYGSLGIGGIPVATFDSGSGGSFSATYSIPSVLMGNPKIAIRLQTANNWFYAYNWFYNNSTY